MLKIKQKTKLVLAFVFSLALVCNTVFFSFLQSYAATDEDVDVSLQVLLAPPENLVVTNTAPGEVGLTWDKSPSADYGNVDAYSVYVKLKTDPTYPLVPTITRYDMLPAYTDSIIGLNPNQGYDFIVYAVSPNLVKSPFDCASCKATNQTCGNSVKEPGEECDDLDFGGQLCTDFGYAGGSLVCNVSCEISYSSCTSDGGGTSGPPPDSIPPIPGTAIAPQYAKSGPMQIIYSGASDAGGSGLAFVELWYKRGTTAWTMSGLTSSGTSGSFSFNSFTTQNTYYFDLVAQDNQGNRSANPTGNGDDDTIYDNTPPSPGTAVAPATANSIPVAITYSGVSDTGGSGFKHVELWYKKGATGTWTNSGLTKTTASGSFDFTNITTDDTYYFDLVAEDNAGNRSAAVIGNGDTNTVYSIARPTATLSGTPANPTGLTTTNITVDGATVVAYKYKLDSGVYGAETPVVTKIQLSGLTAGSHTISVIGKNSLGNWQLETNATTYTWTIDLTKPTATLSGTPANPTYLTTTNITVGGTGVTAYKYKLDSGVYGAETPVATKIQLSGLTAGSHTISVIGKNALGNWQLETSATTYTWTIDLTQPLASISTPSAIISYGTAVSYTITYTGANTVTLQNANITLNKTGTANGTVGISQISQFVFLVTVANITGDGTLGISIAAGTASNNNGLTAPAAGPSVSFVVKPPTACGDGFIDQGEECDDGNKVSGDGCNATCVIEYCGDGIVNDVDEGCDDGNKVSGDGCSSSCVTEYCGDGTINNVTEQCDDGNTLSGDGCRANCQTEYCGDGIINNVTEQCDDGNTVSGDGCRANCVTEYCGDGFVNNITEECDDGNKVSGDGCSNTCLVEVDHCKNDVKDADEEDVDCGGADCMECALLIDHCENEIKDEDEQGVDCGGNDCVACPTHCENGVKDEDEKGVDCGGADCVPCATIEVNFEALAALEGAPAGNYALETTMELYNKNIGFITNSLPAVLQNTGDVDFSVAGVLPGNYDIGMKGDGYLRAIIPNVPLYESGISVDLDFTFDNTYKVIGGDVWPDNIVNALDVALLISIYSTSSSLADLNRDGYVNAADIALIIKNYYQKGGIFS